MFSQCPLRSLSPPLLLSEPFFSVNSPFCSLECTRKINSSLTCLFIFCGRSFSYANLPVRALPLLCAEQKKA